MASAAPQAPANIAANQDEEDDLIVMMDIGADYYQRPDPII